jgi:hypothetical protein
MTPAQPYRANGTGCTHTSLPNSTLMPAATRGGLTLVSDLWYGPLLRVVRLSAILIGRVIVLRRRRRLRRLQLCLRWRMLLRDEAIEGTILPPEERGHWEIVNREALRGQVDFWCHYCTHTDVFDPHIRSIDRLRYYRLATLSAICQYIVWYLGGPHGLNSWNHALLSVPPAVYCSRTSTGSVSSYCTRHMVRPVDGLQRVN